MKKFFLVSEILSHKYQWIVIGHSNTTTENAIQYVLNDEEDSEYEASDLIAEEHKPLIAY